MNLYFKISKALKKYFWTGIATLFPIFVTVYIFFLIFNAANHLIGRHFQDFFSSRFNFTIPGFGVILTFLIIVVFGMLSRWVLGKWLASSLDGVLKKIPLVANVYPSAKKLSDFLFSAEDKKKRFQKVVLVEFPMPGTWSLGFVTNENLMDLNIDLPEEYVCVLVPLAPAPFSGFVYWAPKGKIKELEIGIDKALAFILSGGVVSK